MEQYGNNDYEDYEQECQRPPPSKYQVRPRVDADADGEVDPNLWVPHMHFYLFARILVRKKENE